jgi:List-Bact-rpt repeat protein
VLSRFLCGAGLVLAALCGPAGAASLQLSWRDNSPNEDGFRIERRTGPNGTFSQISTVGANVVSYRDATLSVGSQYCYRLRAFNSAGNSPYSDESCATAQAGSWTLSITKSGAGGGTVVSTPAGISCGAACTETYTSAATVTLSAIPATTSAFTGWSGGGCGGTGACALLLNASTTVRATFELKEVTLTVLMAGGGKGTVTSSLAGIDCGTDCGEAYPNGTAVTLTASPTTGSVFRGWTGGGCSGTGSCRVSITADTSVTAYFY